MPTIPVEYLYGAGAFLGLVFLTVLGLRLARRKSTHQSLLTSRYSGK